MYGSGEVDKEASCEYYHFHVPCRGIEMELVAEAKTEGRRDRAVL